MVDMQRKCEGQTKRDCQSFKLELPELHCCIYVLVLQTPSSSWAEVMAQLRDDVQKLGLVSQDNIESQRDGFEEIHARLKECEQNPAFTFEWSATEMVVVLKLECFEDETDASFFGTLVHELSHAVTMVFESLGLKTDDDEHRSIVIGNLVEASFDKIFQDGI